MGNHCLGPYSKNKSKSCFIHAYRTGSVSLEEHHRWCTLLSYRRARPPLPLLELIWPVRPRQILGPLRPGFGERRLSVWKMEFESTLYAVVRDPNRSRCRTETISILITLIQTTHPPRCITATTITLEGINSRSHRPRYLASHTHTHCQESPTHPPLEICSDAMWQVGLKSGRAHMVVGDNNPLCS